MYINPLLYRCQGLCDSGTISQEKVAALSDWLGLNPLLPDELMDPLPG